MGTWNVIEWWFLQRLTRRIRSSVGILAFPFRPCYNNMSLLSLLLFLRDSYFKCSRMPVWRCLEVVLNFLEGIIYWPINILDLFESQKQLLLWRAGPYLEKQQFSSKTCLWTNCTQMPVNMVISMEELVCLLYLDLIFTQIHQYYGFSPSVVNNLNLRNIMSEKRDVA